MSQAIRASQEQDLLRAMSQGIRASQEQDLLNCAMQRSLEDRGNRMPAKSSQAEERDMVNRAVQRSLSHAHSAPEPLAPPVAPPASNPTLTRGSEDKELDAAIQRSISLARKVESIAASSAERESDDDAMLRRAMEASILQAQLEEAATRARAGEELERVLEASKLHADLPTPLLEAPPLTYSQDVNSVRTLEDEIVRTNGYTAVAPTAAAARSPRGISTSKPVRTSESVSANYAAQIGLGIYV
jgi:hypothetical protein